MMDRRLTLLDICTLILCVLIGSLALWTLTQAPDVLYPMQFGADGKVNRWGQRSELALVFGFMSVMVAITAGMMGWYAGQSDDPARKRNLRMGQLVSLISIGGVSAVMVWACLGSTFGASPPSVSWIMALTGVILTLTGAGLGKVGPNPLLGVRTPWSFKSRLAWDRSNRLAGRLFFWLGLGLIASAPVAPQPIAMMLTPALILIAAVWSVFESWRVWRSDPERQPF